MKQHQAMSLAGDEKLADNLLNQWLVSRPDDLAVRAYLARHYLNAGQYKESIAQYEYLRAKAPRDARVLNNLAWLYQQRNDPRALQTAEKALELAPDSPQLQDTLGWILVQQSDFARGRDILAKAATKSDSPSLHYHYATALARSGDKEGAKHELTSILKPGGESFPERAQAEELMKGL